MEERKEEEKEKKILTGNDRMMLRYKLITLKIDNQGEINIY